MFTSSSSWRDRYYATSLDEVLSIFYESKKKKPSVDRVENEMDGPQNKSLIFMKSGQSVNSTDSPTTTLTDGTFLGSPDSCGKDSNTTLAWNNSSSSSPVDSISTTFNASMSCPYPPCKASFRAKKDQDQRTNLLRHIRTQHTPDLEPYACPVSGCGKTYTRSDYVKRHCRDHHGVESNARSESLGKRKRTTVT